MHKCIKCNKCFKSQYLLNKHLNRKCPCTVIFKCEKCNYVFNAKHILVNHLKRKTPCVEVVEVKQDHELVRLEIEIRKLDIKEKKLDIREKELEAKKEMLALKNQNRLEIEKLKTERKQQTVNYINEMHVQNNIQNNINIEQNFIQNIHMAYGDKPNIISVKDAAEQFGEYINENDTIARDIFNNYKDVEDLLITCLRKMYLEDSNKPIAYNALMDTYYKINFPNTLGKLDIIKSNIGEIETDVRYPLKYFVETLSSIANSMKMRSKDTIEKQDLGQKYNELINIQNNIKEIDIHPISSEAFGCKG